jgi:hypothetical protein
MSLRRTAIFYRQPDFPGRKLLDLVKVTLKYHGIDAVLWDSWLIRSVVMEAKGGNSSLGYTNKGRQMSKTWIADKWERIYGQYADDEKDAGRPMSTDKDSMWAIVVKLNLKRKNTILAIEFQIYPDINDRWGRSLPKII